MTRSAAAPYAPIAALCARQAVPEAGMPTRLMSRPKRPRVRSSTAEAEDIQHQRGLG